MKLGKVIAAHLSQSTHPPFIQYCTAPGKSKKPPKVALQCHVTITDNKRARGISSFKPSAIGIQVPVRKNREVLNELGKALDVAISKLKVVRGQKSRDKLITVKSLPLVTDDEDATICEVLRRLEAAKKKRDDVVRELVAEKEAGGGPESMVETQRGDAIEDRVE